MTRVLLFAAQGIVGAAFPISSLPGLAITTEYRFMALTGTRTYNAGLTVESQQTLVRFGTFQLGHDYNNTFLFGIRYNFGVAPPPPPPAAPSVPAPAPARSYLVFFDWDKATLTDRARQIIHEAADNSTRVQDTRIEVNGYTDTSGTPKYNQGLSVVAPRRCRPNWSRMACRRMPSPSRASATRICWCRPAPGFASRRTVASKSSSADQAAFILLARLVTG